MENLGTSLKTFYNCVNHFMEMNVNSFNRLSLGLMEKEQCSPQQAIDKLRLLEINLICGDQIKRSLPLQAALLTAVNTAKRAFLGGVNVQLPPATECLVPWPGKRYLNDIVTELGGAIVRHRTYEKPSLMFGLEANIDNNEMQVVCNDWQAGILVEGSSTFESTGTIPTGGIFAGAFAVGLSFLKASGVTISACDSAQGISLWRPDLNWLSEEAKGPAVTILPAKYWMLGLGHLGQAYLWNIGLLPYKNDDKPTIVLQDIDKIVAANWSAGLLSEIGKVDIYKTRVCSEWLSQRRFETIICERRFDEHTKRIQEEPFVALCGFDSAKSRLQLENAGFDLVVEAGLGSRISTFDIISLHTFPNGSNTPDQIWGADDSVQEINEVIYNILKSMDTNEVCGIIPLTIAGKTLSASFVGACTGALVIAELIRGLHNGRRYDKLSLQLRDIEGIKSSINSNCNYTIEQGRNGYKSF
jgi:hypothetical protein